MEWKQSGAGRRPKEGAALETFLGGMETPRCRARRYAYALLETFLGGMETSSKLEKFCAVSTLETFLGGMETTIH